MTAPQPSLKARLITLRFVPGGPEPMTKGFGSLRPSTMVASVGISGGGERRQGPARRKVSQLGRLSRAALRAPSGLVDGSGMDAVKNRLVSKLELGQFCTRFPTHRSMPLDPKRTVAELKELRMLTGDADGAQ